MVILRYYCKIAILFPSLLRSFLGRVCLSDDLDPVELAGTLCIHHYTTYLHLRLRTQYFSMTGFFVPSYFCACSLSKENDTHISIMCIYFKRNVIKDRDILNWNHIKLIIRWMLPSWGNQLEMLLKINIKCISQGCALTTKYNLLVFWKWNSFQRSTKM